MIYILIYQRREGFIYCYCLFFVYPQDVHAANSLLLGPGSEWSTRHRPMPPLPHNIMRCDSCSFLQLFWCVCVCIFFFGVFFFLGSFFFFFSSHLPTRNLLGMGMCYLPCLIPFGLRCCIASGRRSQAPGCSRFFYYFCSLISL